MIEKVDVLVVGAGPTGLLLAAELRRRHVDCLLAEAHDAPMAWDRATVVHPRSIEIFDALGIADPLIAAGVRQRFGRIHSGGERLGEIDLALSGSRYPFNIGVSEEVTEAVLADHLARLEGVVARSTRVIDLHDRGDGVLATLERAGVRMELLAGFVVGCDGHRSTVRALAGIEQDGHEIEAPWAVFDAAVRDFPHSHDSNYAYLDRTPIILTTLPGQRWRVYLRPSASDSDLVADAAATLSRYLRGAAFEAVANPTRFNCRTRVARQYRSGRFLLAGDAAHSCSPSEGHGMNSGLQDAFNLGWKLALVVKGRAAAALLDSYQAERRPVAEKITASGDKADAAELARDPADRRARDETIRAMLADPEKRHQEAVAEAELDIDYGGSPIVIGAAPRGIGPGRLWYAPIEVNPAGGPPQALHRLAHRAGHTAILVGGASVGARALADLHRKITADTGGLIEACFVLSAQRADGAYGGIDPADAERLGVDGATLFVVRPDGYVGMRADADHAETLAAYSARLGVKGG